ncbi:hypothetical protein [Halobacterium noricense]|uniref:hypothetical protein n=1 Tax=Halobacterium noricense TaxID=223182 RepID=UPI001E648BB2|nr:hypothetical protein [Halobacterium noricense]UHH24587.1 hypothetical protein LT974_11405 [Halobacterium noricense]
MAPTVDDLRNEIRESVGRYTRVESTGFTKEALAAICGALGYDVKKGSLPSKSVMRAEIRARVGLADEADPESAGGAFRKADLEAIAEVLRED